MEAAGAGEDDGYVKDGSGDLLGRPVRRSEKGGWTACAFLVVYEVFERMAFYGIYSNLVIYLTGQLHQGTVEAANNVTTWIAAVFLTPIAGAYVADAHLGRYWTFVLGSAVYLLGMCLLTVAVSVPSQKRPASTFFAGLYVLAVGNGGAKPTISTIAADQFDETHPGEKLQKLSLFNWWVFSIFLGTLAAHTVLVYVQDNVGWPLGYGIPTAALLASLAVFLAGTRFYRHKLPQGSPFASMARVIVSALRNRRLKRQCPAELTDSWRFLNKAAIEVAGRAACTAAEVEQTKQMLRMLPVLGTMFVPCMILAQNGTLFVKQGTTLDRHIGRRFSIPPASLGAFTTVTMLASVAVYDRLVVPAVRRRTKNPRGISLLQRLSIGLLLQTLAMLAAALTERRRLAVAAAPRPPPTIFILLPQFVLIGVSDAFFLVVLMEFFYDQAPASMKSLGTSCTFTAYAAGNLLSTFILAAVSDITKRAGRGWILNDLNHSRLDYYYLFLAAVSALNFLVFFVVARAYRYRPEPCSAG